MKRKLILVRLAALVLMIFAFIILTTCKQPTNNNGTNKDWEKYKIRENLTTQKLVEEMGIGINLGNTLDATGDWINSSKQSNFETAWGSPIITEAMIKGYAKAGFSSLRIPVTWDNMFNNSTNKIHPDVMARVKTIVDWTIDSGMIALINTHHDSKWIHDYPTNQTKVMNKFVAIWEQICEQFKDYGDRLMFESMNEIGFELIWNEWSGTAAQKQEAFGYNNALNQKFVDVVRGSGGNNAKRHLLINVYQTNDTYAYDPLFKMPTDPANRCAASVHYYSPAEFAILGPGHNADWAVGLPSGAWGTPAHLNELNNAMQKLKINCVDKGIPVIIGEFAACGSEDNGVKYPRTTDDKRLYAVKVAEAAYSRGMCPMLWDCQGDQYDRKTQKWVDPKFLPELMAIR